MPTQPMHLPTAANSRKTSRTVEDLFNNEMVTRVFEDDSIPAVKLETGIPSDKVLNGSTLAGTTLTDALNQIQSTIVYKNETITTQGLGAGDFFAFGFYKWNAAASNLSQLLTNVLFGGVDVPYAAHPFIVAGGAGAVDAGQVGLRVTGTSITDAGVRTPNDTDILTNDITTLVLNQYIEAKKFIGRVTFELFTVSGVPTVYSLSINVGMAKYEDFGNRDFTVTDFEVTGLAGANDNGFELGLYHHTSSAGWTYSPAAFSPNSNVIVDMGTDHGTENNLDNGEAFVYKRAGITGATIGGNDSEGVIVKMVTTAANTVEYANIHIGVVLS